MKVGIRFLVEHALHDYSRNQRPFIKKLLLITLL